MNKRIFIFLLLLLPFWGKSQIQIHGKVVDEFGFAVSDVLVYLDGSSISTYSDSNGEFNLKIPDGTYNLVFRKEEFKVEIIPINSETNYLEVTLKKSEPIELNEAVIVKLSEEKWKEYYALFKDLFLGQNLAASQCEIVNPKVLHFNYDNESFLLTARASSPIIIQNKYLGYTIEYDLTNFSMDFQSHFQYVEGTTLFTEWQGSKSKTKKWKKNRLVSYNGSIMHFLRSLYRENLKEEGFIINRLIRKENPNFIIYQKNVKEMISRGETLHVGSPPPKIIQTLVKAEVSYDSLRIKNEGNSYLNFEGLYDIEFTKEKEDMDYVQIVKGKNLVGNQISVIYLLNEKLVEIEANGNFYPPSDLMTEGYFTWEKAANLLPLDYQPY